MSHKSVVYNRNHNNVAVKYLNNDVVTSDKNISIKITKTNDNLCIKLIDINQPSFNYSATIDLLAFNRIKIEQCLDLDFDNYKVQLIELLELTCSNKMLIRLELDEKTCRIVFYEKYKIKCLVFLTVDLIITDRSEIIEELSATIVQLKDNVKNLEAQLVQSRRYQQESDLLLKSAKQVTVQLEKMFIEEIRSIETVLVTKVKYLEKQAIFKMSLLSERLTQIGLEMKTLKKTLSAKCEDNFQLSHSLQLLRIEKEKANRMLHNVGAEIDCLRQQKSQLEMEIRAFQQSLLRKDQTIEELEKKCKEQEEDMKKAATIILQKQQAHNDLSKDLAQANTMLVNFNNHYDKIVSELENLQSAISNKDEIIRRQREEIEAFANENQEHRRRGDISNEEMNRLKRELFAAKLKIEELEKLNRETNKINGLLTKKLTGSPFGNDRNGGYQ